MDPVLVKIGTSLMMLVGVVVMFVNIVKYRRLLNKHSQLRHGVPDALRFLFGFHMSLMVFFFLGYIGVFSASIYSIAFFSEMLVGAIFLFGAGFVMLSIVVQNRMLMKDRENYFNTIRMLIRAVEIRDPYTMGHSEHVANLCMLCYSYLPHSIKKSINAELLHSTALMHDIGKIGVPERILNKTDRLSNEEWEAIRRHTIIGKDFLSKMDEYSTVPDWVAYHHERIDGGGYHGLINEEIPFPARLLAVTDTFSAIVTNRPYRRGKSYSDAISILRSNAGTQLDANIVDVFCQIPRDEVEACRPQSLVLDFLKEIEEMEQRMAQGGDLSSRNAVLSVEAGRRWLRNLAEFCKQREEPMALAALSLEGVADMEQSCGYHAVDEVVERIGVMLIDNIRNTDIVVHCRRDVFILALPDCPKEVALNLLDRLIREIATQFENTEIIPVLKVSRQMLFYYPDQDDTWDALISFLGEHLKIQ